MPSPQPSEAAVEAAMKFGLFRRSEARGLVEAVSPHLRAQVLEEVREAHSTLSENAFLYWLDDPSPLTPEDSP